MLVKNIKSLDFIVKGKKKKIQEYTSLGWKARRTEFLGIEKHLGIKFLSDILWGGASYRKYKYWWVKSGLRKIWSQIRAALRGKNRQLGIQLSSQFICVSHPTVCDINRILNLAMNYFYIVNLWSHFPYVATTPTSNNSLWSLKCFQLILFKLGVT